jgi:uncharacterized protein YjiS (DUF1127 family)
MFFDKIKNWYENMQKYHRIIQELSNYSDRELHEIGIDRADIPFIALKAVNFR